MKHILIADAGSTKIEWALISENGSSRHIGVTPGINPVMATDAALVRAIEGVVDLLNGVRPDKVYYYGAGCLPHIVPHMAAAITEALGVGDVSVESDLLGAARALLGRERGVACILGTGSNSGLYDGEKIIENVPSLGFIIGDEGSGAALGKHLLGDIFKGVFPPVLREAFFKETCLTLPEVIDRTYRAPEPNKFLASLVPFISRHIERPHVRHMVTIEFCNFMARNVAQYSGYDSMPVAFCGSIAANFRTQFQFAAASVGCTLGKVMASPIKGLIEYHSAELTGCRL